MRRSLQSTLTSPPPPPETIRGGGGQTEGLEHFQGGYEPPPSGTMEGGGRQGDHQPQEARRLRAGTCVLHPCWTKGGWLTLGQQDQGGRPLQKSSGSAGMGAGSFLNADVEEEVYVTMAPGYEKYVKSRVPFVIKLEKSLYALRQSPKNWFGTMDDRLSNIEFRSLKSNPCVYVFEHKTGIAILILCVDDTLLLGKNKQLLGKLKKKLMDRFEMTDLGDVSKVLDMNVNRDRQNWTITIDQKYYTENILKRYGATNCNVVFTPGVGPEISLDQPADRLLDEQVKHRYQSTAGALIYLAQVSQYDILYVFNQLARAMSKP